MRFSTLPSIRAISISLLTVSLAASADPPVREPQKTPTSPLQSPLSLPLPLAGKPAPNNAPLPGSKTQPTAPASLPTQPTASTKPGTPEPPVLPSLPKDPTHSEQAGLGGEIGGINAQKSAARAEIDTAKMQAERMAETVQGVEARIAQTRQNLNLVNTRLADLAQQRATLTTQWNDTQSRLAQQRETLSRRLRDTYKRGATGDIQVLFASRSVHDLLSRGYYLQCVVESDTRLIRTIRQDAERLAENQRKLETQTSEQHNLATQFETQKAMYVADLTRKAEMLAQAQDKQDTAQDELDDLEDESSAMTDRIRNLSDQLRKTHATERQARQEARKQRRRYLARLRRSSHSALLAGADLPDLPDLPTWSSGFIRPCEGPITSPFGYRMHPILHREKLHAGVDFGAGYGAPIAAAGSGTVLLASYTNGYGNCVIVDHGNGVTTLYGHCSELLVVEGQTVRQGQLIARVGATGLATGPHLHFEVRHNGVPAPPF